MSTQSRFGFSALVAAGLCALFVAGPTSSAYAFPVGSAESLGIANTDLDTTTVQYYGYHRYYHRGAALRREGWYPGQGLRRARAYRYHQGYYRGY